MYIILLFLLEAPFQFPGRPLQTQAQLTITAIHRPDDGPDELIIFMRSAVDARAVWTPDHILAEKRPLDLCIRRRG